jgi:hypothetical protein
MAAHVQARPHSDPKYQQPELRHIGLDRPTAIQDDCGVLEISARKVAIDTGSPWCEITLEGE